MLLFAASSQITKATPIHGHELLGLLGPLFGLLSPLLGLLSPEFCLLGKLQRCWHYGSL